MAYHQANNSEFSRSFYASNEIDESVEAEVAPTAATAPPTTRAAARAAAATATATATTTRQQQQEQRGNIPTENPIWALLDRCSPIQQDPYNPEYIHISCSFIVWSLIAAIIICITVPLSYHYVDYDKYALLRNNYGTVHLTPTLTQGRYFYPLSYGLVYFDAIYDPIDFESTVFAENGLEFDLYIRFYYRIPKEQVGNIYNKYSKSYHARIGNDGKKMIKNVCTEFKVQDYIYNRTYIKQRLAENVTEELRRNFGIDVPKQYFSIINVVFPDSLVDTSLNSALAVQNTELKKIQQVVSLIDSQTSQQVAQIDAETSLILQNADNSANKIIGTSNAQANKILNTARSRGITSLFATLNITNSDEKTALLRAMSLFDTNAISSTFMVDVSSNSLIQV